MLQSNFRQHSHLLVQLCSLLVFFSLMLSCTTLPEREVVSSEPVTPTVTTEPTAGLPAVQARLHPDVKMIAEPQPTASIVTKPQSIKPIPLKQFARQTRQGLRITLSDNELFTSKGTQLTSTAQGKLLSLANYLQANPQQRVIIEGYDNGNGSNDYLLGLSLRYAQIIRLALVEQAVSSKRLQVRAFGKQQPTGQSQQRVEILVLN